MEKNFKWFVVFFLSIFMFVFPLGLASAAEFPTKPITLWIGYNPGGETDLSGRAIAEAGGKYLGQPIVPVNKPGGSGALMLSNLMGVKPDGYTIGVMTMGSLLASHMRKVPYECARDFTPIIHYGGYAFGFAVQPNAPWKDFKEYLNWAKENPGKAKYSTTGLGGPQHLAMERMAIERKTQLIPVPYASGHEAVVAILGGHVSAGALGGDWIPYVRGQKEDKLRCLMVFLGKRMKQFPEIPSIREFGFNFDAPNMIGIVGPKGMPEGIVKKLHEGFKKAMADPIFVNGLESHFMPITYRNSEDFGKFIAEADREQGTLIRKLGLRKE